MDLRRCFSISVAFLVGCSTLQPLAVGQTNLIQPWDFVDVKNYQVAARFLGEQWFYAMKLYAADVMFEIMVKDFEEASKYKEAQSSFADRYKDALYALAAGDVPKSQSEMASAERFVRQIKHESLGSVLFHFLGLLQALQAKAHGGAEATSAKAKTIVIATKGQLDSPEWHHYLALLEYHTGNVQQFEKHVKERNNSQRSECQRWNSG